MNLCSQGARKSTLCSSAPQGFRHSPPRNEQLNLVIPGLGINCNSISEWLYLVACFQLL